MGIGGVPRPVLLLLGAAIMLLVVFHSISRPPGERYGAVLERQADDPSVSRRDSMYARWQMAERYFRQGDYDAAQKEYQRIIDEYPYTQIEYGFRTDDARQRIREIQALRRGERPQSPFPEY